ncbi:MAG: cobalt-precorrin-7 (C(5))-methyltransferase, partial [Planctomycetota bacterium]|nr:cobalt-precorrin-7 (C(5))-methyltransferase [Planctomycetota bacterium]
ARRGRRIAVLVTGDTGLCSFAQPVLKRFGREACTLIPGISSVQVAFARLGLDWLDARILSTHREAPKLGARTRSRYDKLAILLGRRDSLVWVATLARNLGKEYRVFVCENLTLGNERVREVPAARLRRLKVSSLAIALLVKKGLLA